LHNAANECKYMHFNAKTHHQNPPPLLNFLNDSH